MVRARRMIGGGGGLGFCESGPTSYLRDRAESDGGLFQEGPSRQFAVISHCFSRRRDS
jgi:hypothetical protein